MTPRFSLRYFILLNGHLYHVCKQHIAAQPYIISTIDCLWLRRSESCAYIPTTQWSTGFMPCARLPVYIILWSLVESNEEVKIAVCAATNSDVFVNVESLLE